MASLGINGEAAGDYVQQCFFTEGYCSSPGPLCAEPRCRRGSTEPGDCRHERQRLCRESGETLAWDDIPKVSWGETVSRDKCSSHSSGEPSTMMTMLVVIKDDDGHHHPHPPSPHHHHRHKIVITTITIILVLVTITIVSLVISGSNLDEQSDNDKGDVGVEEERAIIWIRTGSMNKVIAMTATSALMGILTLNGNDDDHDDDDMLVMTMLLTMMMMTMMMIMIMMPMVAKMTRQEPQPETSFKH